MQNKNPIVNEMVLADMMHQIVSKSISSHDIISRASMPTFCLADIPQRREQFGDAAVELYISHLEFSRRVQDILTGIINQTEAFSRLSLLMITMHKMGVAEAHGLVTMMYSELLKLRFTNFTSVMLFNPELGKGHAVLIVGDISVKVGDAFPRKFEQFRDDVLIIDPLLSFIGPANHYATANAAYLSNFNYSQIMSVQPALIEHLSFITTAERRADELVALLKDRYRLEPFMPKALLPLAKTGYDCRNVTIVTDAPVLTELRKSGLNFFGVQRSNHEMDAVCSAESRLEVLQAVGLSKKIPKGRFYHNHARFYVIPKIETPEELERIIQEMSTPELKK